MIYFNNYILLSTALCTLKMPMANAENINMNININSNHSRCSSHRFRHVVTGVDMYSTNHKPNVNFSCS